MKKIIGVAIIILLIIRLSAQNSEVDDQTEIEISDSLNTENTIVDTMNTSTENIDIYNKMDQFIKIKKHTEDELLLPYLIYNENFHLSTLFNFDVNIKENGFSKIPFATSTLQCIQNNRKIYNTKFKSGNLYYSNYAYSLPVAITESYMGLGDNDMNNIYFTFLKGSIFGINNLNVQLDFLGETGKWLGFENESTQNLDFHLYYELDSSVVHFNTSTVDQDLPGEKSIYLNKFAFDTAKNNETEYSFIFENIIADLGIKYDKIDFKIADIFRQKRYQTQFLISKDLDFEDHFLNISDELIISDVTVSDKTEQDTIRFINREETYNLVSYDHSSKVLGFTINNTGFYRNSNYYSHSSYLKQKLFFGLSLEGEFFKRSKEYYPNLNSINQENYDYSKSGIGLGLNSILMNLKIMYGQQSGDLSDENYLDLQNRINIPLTQKFRLTLKQWVGYKLNDISPENLAYIIELPKWQTSNYVQFIYEMDHNNAIKFGLNYHYHSDYYYLLDYADTIFENNSQNIDVQLIIQITDRFEISANAINITNQKVMFTNQSQSGTHFNFNVHWIFIN